MTAADDFTRADALFRRALSKQSKDGAPLQIMPTRKFSWVITVLIAGVVAGFVFWWGRL